MAGIALPGGGTLYGDSTIVPVPGAIAARTTWQAAGGETPAFGAANFGGGATPIDLGAAPSILSTFTHSGGECFATVRLKSGGAGAAGGVGAWTITGLPVPPKIVGAGVDGGQNIGYGFLLDAGDGLRETAVRAVVDPGLPTDDPVLFIIGKAGVADATDVIVPVDFSFGGDDIPAHDSTPFNFVSGCILNLTLQYEGDFS